MNKVQFEKEIRKKIEILMGYIGEVQKIPNYRYDISCQDFFTMTDSVIKKMRRVITNCTSLPDVEFNKLDFNKIFEDLDKNIETSTTWLANIKAKGWLERPISSYNKD